MAIPVTCACGRTLRVRDGLAGRNVRCPTCSRPVAVPVPAPEPSPELAAPPLPSRITCPYCASEIASTDARCPYCQEDPHTSPEPRKPSAAGRPSRGPVRPRPRRAVAPRRPASMSATVIVAIVFLCLDIGVSLLALVGSAMQGGRGATPPGSEAYQTGYQAGQSCALVLHVLLLGVFAGGVIGLLQRRKWGWLLGVIATSLTSGLVLLACAGIAVLGSSSNLPQEACACVAAILVFMLVLYAVPLALLIKARNEL